MRPLNSLKWFIHEHPTLYPVLQGLRGQSWGTFCTADTDLCIEGYQSSSNSFAYNVFRLLDPSLHIGHHTHSVANLKRAAQHDVPTLILYRPPADCIPSMVARFKPSLEDGVTRYVRFYQYVLDHREAFMLASFEETTQRIAATIERVEMNTSLDLGTYDADSVAEEAVAHIQAWTKKQGDEDRISLPKPQRDTQKKALRKRLCALASFTEAQQVYDQLEHCFQSTM